MANGFFNIARGFEGEYYRKVKENDPAASGFVIVVLKAAEAADTLVDYDNLSLLLAAAGNTESDFTNYNRKVLTDTDLAAVPAPDDVNNRTDYDLPDQTFTAAGGALNNTTAKAVVCYDPDTAAGDDTTIIPITHYDFVRTTDGSDLPLQFSASGSWRV